MRLRAGDHRGRGQVCVPLVGVVVTMVTVLGWTPGARGQVEGAPLPASRGDGASDSARSALPDWRVEVNARAWWLSPSGKIRLPGSSAAGNGDMVRVDDLNLDTPRFGPYAEVHVESSPWRLSFGGGAFSLDRDQTEASRTFQVGELGVSPGDSLSVSFEFVTTQVTAGYRLGQHDFKAHSVCPEDAVDTVLTAYVVGGVRLYEFDVSVRQNAPAGSGPSSAQSDQLFVEPIVGVRLEAEIARRFGIDFELTGGGYGDSDRSSLSVDVSVAFAWRPCEAVGVEIGWRQLAYRARDGEIPGEFEYNGRMAGLFAGLTVRF